MQLITAGGGQSRSQGREGRPLPSRLTVVVARDNRIGHDLSRGLTFGRLDRLADSLVFGGAEIVSDEISHDLST